MYQLSNARPSPLTLLSLLALASACLLGACDGPNDNEDEDEADIEGEADVELCANIEESRECDSGEQYCDMIDGELQWGACLSATECVLGESYSCGLGLGITYSCYLENGVPSIDQQACNTPLVLSFDDAPVRFSSSAASFDINGAGECLNTDWPTAATPWLALDRDRNGAIDGGHELFGTGTLLHSGRHAENGFLALAQLDSNGDGRLNADDARFHELVLWSDSDDDRRSSLRELIPIANSGLLSIELAYEHDRRCDQRGNCEGPRARFEYRGPTGRTRSGEVIDVSMACQ